MAKQEETNVWRQILLDASPLGFRLYRNQRYKGQIVRNGVVTNSWADCGLRDGAGDLIGYRIIEITQDMVGQKIAQFANIETKRVSGGKVSEDQEKVIKQVLNDGGFACVARSIEDIKRIC